MYIVTSKPKRMSLYSGVSHFIVVILILINLLGLNFITDINSAGHVPISIKIIIII